MYVVGVSVLETIRLLALRKKAAGLICEQRERKNDTNRNRMQAGILTSYLPIASPVEIYDQSLI